MPLLTVGAVSVCSVMTWVQVELLPAQSVVVQVRVMTLVQPPGLLCDSVGTTVNDVPQASLAVTVAATGISAAQCTVLSPGQPLNTGGLVNTVALRSH